jgi:tRNA(Ile)-lysidine synthase
MGDTRRSPPADGAASRNDPGAAVARALAAALPAGGRIAVALSGGRDSVALLDATLAVVAHPPFDVIAFHVDHGLSTHAGAWAQFCRELCARRNIACHDRSVEVAQGPRISVEAAARSARYAALTELAREQRVAAVLLAHHADDQAETTLLQLLRGAGPRGLAAMPAARFDGSVWWLRPFLSLTRARIDDYAMVRGLRHVDDDSNTRSRYRRNALRKDVVPALRRIAPGYPATLLRAAELQAEAAALLDDLAALDARDAYDGSALDCSVLSTLDARRGRNLLRWFLRDQRLPAPSQARLAQMLQQVTGARPDARIAIKHAGHELGVHRGRVVVHRVPVDAYSCEWDGAQAVRLPHGTLTLTRGIGTGIAARHVAASTVTIRSGVAGERLTVAGRTAPRAVAELLRDAGIPRWDRQAIPRLYCGATLAAVPTLGIDAAFAAAPGEPGYAPAWHSSPRADAA